MTKVAIKTRISLFSVELITLRTFSQSWALKDLPNLYWVNVEVAAKHSAMEVFSDRSQRKILRNQCKICIFADVKYGFANRVPQRARFYCAVFPPRLSSCKFFAELCKTFRTAYSYLCRIKTKVIHHVRNSPSYQ